METRVIFDGITASNLVSESEPFRNGKHYFITSSSINEDEYLELGLVIVALIPSLEGTLEKIVYSNNDNSIDSDRVYALPSEVSDSNVAHKAYIYSSVSVNLRLYVITSDKTLESISTQIEALELASETNTSEIIQAIVSVLVGSPNLLPLSLNPEQPFLNTGNNNDEYPLFS